MVVTDGLRSRGQAKVLPHNTTKLLCSVAYGPLVIARVEFDGRCNISKICPYNNFTDIYTNTAQRRMNVYTQSGTTYT